LGGEDGDCGNSIAIDSSGNSYIAGLSCSNDFPMTQTVGGEAAPGCVFGHKVNLFGFVVKLNPSGKQLLFSSIIGASCYVGFAGPETFLITSITVDFLGNTYLTGSTWGKISRLDGVPGYNINPNGYCDAFVVKLNPSGTQILYFTYLGGEKEDYSTCIAVDSSGNVYVTGYTQSSDFPMTETVGGQSAPGYDRTFNGNQDAFVVKKSRCFCRETKPIWYSNSVFYILGGKKTRI